MRVACVGAADIDIKAAAVGTVHLGSSNPVTTSRSVGGVACNVARNLGRLGVPVGLFTIVGDDADGAFVIDALADDGVDLAGVEHGDAATATYLAVLDGAGSLVVGAADMGIFDGFDAAWAERVASGLAGYDLMVVDANLSTPGLERLVEMIAGQVPIFADPVSVAKSTRLEPVLAGLDAIFPDAAEAAVLSGRSVDDPESAIEAAGLLRAGGVATVVVTLGQHGLVVVDSGGVRHLPAIRPDRVVDATGAGDALLAGYVFGFVSDDHADAAKLGLAAASLTVETSESVAPGLSAERLAARAQRMNG